MNVGIVFYSRTGNTKKIAELLKQNLDQMKINAELIEIVHQKKLGFLKASRVGMKQTEPPIKNTNYDISKYNTVLVGMPIWAFASPFGLLIKYAPFESARNSFFLEMAM
jgi:menaquinone-dependent protoporphyrinogen IX oxidase